MQPFVFLLNDNNTNNLVTIVGHLVDWVPHQSFSLTAYFDNTHVWGTDTIVCLLSIRPIYSSHTTAIYFNILDQRIVC